jgi:hypothetical protein
MGKKYSKRKELQSFAGKAEGIRLQNLGWREGTDCVQYLDGYERSKLEQFLLDSTGSEYFTGADCFEGQCTTVRSIKAGIFHDQHTVY